MRSEKVFLDTNVALDIIEMRQPHWRDAAILFDLSAKGKIRAYISALSVATISYLLEEKYHPDEVRNKLLQLLQSVEPLPTSKDAVAQAMLSGYRDIEDCLQYFTAQEHHCLMITRDKEFEKFFKESILSPREYCESL